MTSEGLVAISFTVFVVTLSAWAMNSNEYDNVSQHGCTGECYDEWRAETGGPVAIAQAQVEARAQASPAELGAPLYAGCVACHGADGAGGIGPQLSGQSVDALAGALLQYRNGETRGAQSALMWSQAREMSDSDIDNIAAYIATF